jgi:hypothetical protein
MEYQNPVSYLTEFSVMAKTPLWIGRVHPGDPRAALGADSGTQVYIERSYVPLVKEVQTYPLCGDLGPNYGERYVKRRC